MNGIALSIEFSVPSGFGYLAMEPNEQKHRDYCLNIMIYCYVWFTLQVEVYSCSIEKDE